MSLAFVFPGQGSQKVGMGRALAEAFPEAAAVFDEADAALGFPLSRLCFEGPEEELQLTANTQPAILADERGRAAVRWTRAASRPDLVAGHSLGEYSALVAAGSARPRGRGRRPCAGAASTCRRRCRWARAPWPPSWASTCRRSRRPAARRPRARWCRPANLNCPGQVVIAGHAAAVERAMRACKARGRQARAAAAGVRPLPLRADAAGAGAAGRRTWRALPFRDPRVPLVNNVDARVGARRAAECRDGLVRQVSAPVRWQECVELLVREGVDTFVEVGPGTVLSGLVKKIAPRRARAERARTRASLEATAALRSPRGGA